MESIPDPLSAIRACIFDMDGLLINSEDMITRSVNKLLEKYGRPTIARDIRVSLMGVPDSTSSDLFHDWAQVPVAREQFDRELNDEMKRQFSNCEPLPGAEKLLSDLGRARSSASEKAIEIALASSTRTSTYRLKTSKPETKRLLGFFTDEKRILGDDSRIGKGRGKPAPDIYLVALETLRKSMGPETGDGILRPDECLVFEDSIAGVKAGRGAGMRVVWVPHPDVAAELQMVRKNGSVAELATGEFGDEGLAREIEDGWVESIPSLQHFDSEKYGIHVHT